jgi:HD-GYP domain-containing protein (c-di-GMP phosphodiesterase class II)
MKKIIFSTALIVTIVVTSCNKYDANGNLIKSYDELQKANWMLGEWEKTDSLGSLKEIWERIDDSTFVGFSYYIQNKKDTVHYEQVELMQDGEHLIYKSTVKGENNNLPVPFQMTKDEDSLLVFENPKHDYPQKIQYKLYKNGSLIATVSGKQNGKISSESYPMKKKK